MTPRAQTLRPSDAARLIGVSRKTIYQWLESGRLIPVVIFNGHPRIPRDQVERIILGLY